MPRNGLSVQREEFKRLGVAGEWERPYSTMAFEAEARIAAEIMKFAANGLLYRGSKPVMWSVVEKTALAEAEVEYEDHVSDTVFVAFPVKGDAASVVIWTTTPWTLPGNRAISFSHKIAYGLYRVTQLPWTLPGQSRNPRFSHKISYGLYRVTQAPENNWAKVGASYILADKLAEELFKAAKVEGFERLEDVPADVMQGLVCAHPLAHARL